MAEGLRGLWRRRGEPVLEAGVMRLARGALGLHGIAVRLFRPGGSSGQIVPERSVAGTALAIVVGIMSFLACLTVGAVTLVSSASTSWQADIAREITIQVRPIEEVDVGAEAEKAAAIVRSVPGVKSARALSEAENAKLLEPWLGANLDIGDLPLPRLVVVEVGDAAKLDLRALNNRLKAEVRGVSLDDHRAWIDRLRTMAGATVFVGLAVLAMVFGATALCVVFATRGAMVGNRDIVSVLHFVGAEDRFIVSEFQRHFLMLGLRGGLAGAVAAWLLFLALSVIASRAMATPESDQLAILFGQFAVGANGYFWALVVALLIAGMTAFTSRMTVFRYLREIE
jgi:cell division transport system permease protein